MYYRCAIGLITIAALSGASHAGVKTFTATVNSNFDVSGNWSPSGVPDDGDRIVIPGGLTCIVRDDGMTDTWTVDSIEVQVDGPDEGILFIEPEARLILQNDDTNPCTTCEATDHHHIDGQVFIDWTSNGDIGGTIECGTEDHRFDGDGRVEGDFSAGEFSDLPAIEIDGVVVSNGLAEEDEGFRGSLLFTETAGAPSGSTFDNQGLVETARGVIILDEDVALLDISGAIWMVSGSCNPMIFKEPHDTSALRLEGDLVDEAGDEHHFDFQASIWTCGTFIYDGCGLIEIGEDVEFKYAFFSSVACSNPDQVNDGEDCADPFIIDDTYGECTGGG